MPPDRPAGWRARVAEDELIGQVREALFAGGPGAKVIAIVLERRGDALYANLPTDELLAHLDALARRLRAGRLRMPLDGGARWVEEPGG